MQVHEKRKHQDQISMINGNETRNKNEYHPVHPVYQQHVQEQRVVEQRPLDAVHHHHYPQPVLPQPVLAQQGWVQQQGGRVHALYPQHNRNYDEVKYQPQRYYK